MRLSISFCFPVILFLILSEPGLAQTATNLNTEFIGQLNSRGAGHQYANVWGYASNGREYALLGADDGTSIIDVTNPAQPKEVAHIPGPESSWRELRTYKQYAYVVTEGSSPDNLIGVHIIDLSNLPVSATLVKRFVGRLNHGTVHTVSIDGKFLYLNGARNNKSLLAMNLVLDLSDPENPVEAGAWEKNYWHDSQSRNDTIFASAIYGDGIQVIDAKDKSNLKLISQTNYPSNFTHNIWMTDDNKFITQTDETPDMPLNFWDVSDIKNLKLNAEYRAGKHAMAHNAHSNGNLVHVAYYEDGYRVFDISDRKAPVCVGNFDIDGQLPRFGSFTSVWGVYPYLPSGNILLSDIERGLVIVRFTGAKPGYVQGTLSDQFGNPLPGVKVSYLTAAETDESMTVWSDENGNYRIGSLPGKKAFQFSKEGYEPSFLQDIEINSELIKTAHISLRKKFISETTFKLKAAGNESLSGKNITVSNPDQLFTGVTNDAGELQFILPEGNYRIIIKGEDTYWKGQVGVFTFEKQDFVIQLQKGILETFSSPVSWKLSETGDKSVFSWKQEKASQYNSTGFLPKTDGTGDNSNQAMFSRARRSSSSPGVSANSTLTSPEFSLSGIEEPALRFLKFFHPPVNLGAVNDTFRVFLSGDGGQNWIMGAEYSSADEQWSAETFVLSEFGITGKTLKVKFVNTEGVDAISGVNVRPSSYAAVDDIEISSKSNLVSVSDLNEKAKHEFVLFPAYPNPFNPATTLKWQQPFSARVSIYVVNALGQKVKVIPAGIRSAGIQTQSLDFTGFPSGIYFYRIQTSNTSSASGKLLLLK